MPKDDVFNEYAKIAIEIGLVKIASEKSDKSKSKKQNRNSDAIQALYGIKPDANSSIEYEKNIAEYAHPNSVVVSPAHDKINGLVENINERQNIILNIVNDPANGHLNQRKYAQNELVSSLIRVANDIDNRDQVELRILADMCLHQIKKNADSDGGFFEGIWGGISGLFPERLKNNIESMSDRTSGIGDSISSVIASTISGLKGLAFGIPASAVPMAISIFLGKETKVFSILIKTMMACGFAGFSLTGIEQYLSNKKDLVSAIDTAISNSRSVKVDKNLRKFFTGMIKSLEDLKQKYELLMSAEAEGNELSDSEYNNIVIAKARASAYIKKYSKLYSENLLQDNGFFGGFFDSIQNVRNKMHAVNDSENKIKQEYDRFMSDAEKTKSLIQDRSSSAQSVTAIKARSVKPGQSKQKQDSPDDFKP